ncbi:MAG: tRNA 2-thiouridine(34) synthase MnmA [Opitutales bacterium]
MQRPTMTDHPKKLLVALSGGVDSAVAALRLKDAGHDVAGAYMRTWMNEEGSDLFADCPWEQDIADAEAVARHLGIDFEVVNLIRDYRDRVVDYLVAGYRRGTTPNPDIMCNREMKFGVFLNYALGAGFDGVATGHYCRLEHEPDGTARLLEGRDKNKDQSYFLALVRQEQLRRAHFPVGDIAKPEVRKIARRRGLPNAEKKDSQGICFLGKVDINAFLRQYIPDRPGEIVRADGIALGEHRGLHHFTLGQRKGIGLPSNTDHEHFVVVGKDFVNNRLVVAFDSPEAPGLWQQDFSLVDVQFNAPGIPYADDTDLLAKPRYRDPSQRIDFSMTGQTSARVHFETPQRALARGQVCALYDGDRLLGGGFYA